MLRFRKCLVDAVDSMGQRNASSKSRCSSFKRLNSFANVNSKKQLPCLGLIESSPRDRSSLKNITEPID